MKKKIIWIIVSSLMAISLVMVSCGPTVVEEEEEEEEEEIMEEEEEEEEEDGVVTGPEEPEYGGVLSVALNQDIGGFDGVVAFSGSCETQRQTNQELLQGDWTKGPAGTDECDWAIQDYGRFDKLAGCLAESWEILEAGKMLYHIRQGVNWAFNPDSEASRLVNGRELTADDIATSLTTLITEPRSAISHGDTNLSTVTALDKYTLLIEMPPIVFSDIIIMSDWADIYPPEVREKYGDMNDWQNSVGTGPFMLTDYVRGSSATLIRNPNYWETDPIGPGKGNQLPYLDGVKYLIITDVSTRLAALRTAKIDVFHNTSWTDAEHLMETDPELLYRKFYANAGKAIAMRTDKEELPYKDKNVRRALMMATDFNSIKDDYYAGDAQILSWPVLKQKGYEGLYLSLEEAPESVQELYVYNPEKAMELLADAGYPDGFTSRIQCSAVPEFVDYASIIKDMWAKVNVELIIEPKEAGVFRSISFRRANEDMILAGPVPILNAYFGVDWIAAKMAGNYSYVDDPLAWEAKDQMGAVAIFDPNEADRIHKEFMKYLLDQAWAIPAPTPPSYHFWWPWLKNYRGEISVGYGNPRGYSKYVWIDQELKKSMGY